MRIRRILTNNAVVTLDEKGREQIVCGKGIAFSKRSGDEIDSHLITQTFMLAPDSTLQKQLEQILTDIPLEYIELANEIVKMARLVMNTHLGDSLVISLGDHLYETVRRFQEGINISNGLAWEIRRFYDREHEVGLLALDMVEKKLGFRLPQDEAAYIAMHIVNAETDHSTMEETFRRTKLIGDITRIVRMFFGIDFDESSGYYYRFVTHLNYFTCRVLRGEQYVDDANRDLNEIIFEKYKSSYQCAEKISDYVAEKLNYRVSDEEKMYITMHIHMVVSKASRKEK